jgi:ATP diphosphatase
MSDSPGERFGRLVDIMRTLRGPHGCPWDREQTPRSLRPYVLEETYELLDALDRGDVTALREELGDFLFEAVFLAQMADEEGRFDIGDAIQAITDKLIRRHPHVFTPDGRPLGEAREQTSAAVVVERWEVLKAKERGDAHEPAPRSVLDGVPRTLPALLRAHELGSRAAAVGFDWVEARDVLAKVDEELAELRADVARVPANPAQVEEELGDLLFAIVSLARKLDVEPEAALRMAADKFQQRFEGMERGVTAAGLSLKDLPPEEMDRWWNLQKAAEKHGEPGIAT